MWLKNDMGVLALKSRFVIFLGEDFFVALEGFLEPGRDLTWGIDLGLEVFEGFFSQDGDLGRVDGLHVFVCHVVTFQRPAQRAGQGVCTLEPEKARRRGRASCAARAARSSSRRAHQASKF